MIKKFDLLPPLMKTGSGGGFFTFTGEKTSNLGAVDFQDSVINNFEAISPRQIILTNIGFEFWVWDTATGFIKSVDLSRMIMTVRGVNTVIIDAPRAKNDVGDTVSNAVSIPRGYYNVEIPIFYNAAPNNYTVGVGLYFDGRMGFAFAGQEYMLKYSLSGKYLI